MTGEADGTQIRILREVDAIGPDGQVDVGGKRQRTVLAILALAAPSPVSIDRLMTGVWGDNPPPSAPGTLQSYVSRLRRALGADAIELSSAGYALRVSTERLDLAQCRAGIRSAEQAYEEGRTADAIELLRSILASWSSTPLGDLIDSPFAAPALAVLAEERSRVMETLFRWELDEGRGPELVPELEAAVIEDPLREDLWRHLIVALYRSNRLADAMRAYQRAHQSLAEVGLEPGAPLREAGMSVARSDPLLLVGRDVVDAGNSVPNPGNLVPRSDSFVGRDAELARLERVVRAGAVVTVSGPGGIGKTRLVEEFLHRANQSFPDGTWIVELAPLTGRQLRGALIEALSLGHLESTDFDAIADALAGQRLVLALDNCEHIVDEVRACIMALTSRLPELAIVTTSRIPVGLDDEISLAIDPLAVPDTGADPIEARELDAMRLFEARAARPHSGFRVTTVNAAAVAAIVRHLDGLPLAIEMAAALVGLRTPQQIAQSLDSRFELLHPGAADARHETLRSLLDWSYELLTREQQVLFARLSTFAAGFDAVSAAAVCGDDVIDGGRVGDQLEALRTRSLLTVAPGPSARYDMFDTMRAYGRDLVRHLGETRRLRDRHLDFVKRLVRELGPRVRGTDQAQVFARLRAERLEIQRALDWAESVGDHQAIVEIAVQLLPWWRIELVPEEGMRWALLAREHTHDPRALGRLAAGAALLGHAGDRQRSRVLIDAAVEAVERLDVLSPTRAFTLATAGDACTVIGEADLAEELLTAAQRCYREIGDDWGVGYTGLRLFRVLATRAPDLATAEAAAAEFLAALERSGDRHLLAYAHLSRTSMYRLHGRNREALNAARTARALSAPLELVYLDVELLTIEAQLSLSFGDLAIAQEAVAGLRRLVDRRAWSDVKVTVAVLQAELDLACGEYERAHRALEAVLSTHDLNDRRDLADVRSLAALAGSLAGEHFELVDPGAEILAGLWPWDRIEALYRMAAACVLGGRSPVGHLRAALELCRQVDAPVWRTAATQLSARFARARAPERCDALWARAAAYGRSLGARPRIWEESWRTPSQDVAARSLDAAGAADMCAEALALLMMVENPTAG